MIRVTRDSVNSLARWMLVVPAILLILLGFGQAGIASANIPASADTRSKVRADYSPWPIVVVKPLNKGVYEVIQADVGDEIALASPARGEFWATVTPTVRIPTFTSSVSPTAEPSASATYTASPVAAGTVVASTSPSLTPTSPPTASVGATSTRTRTPPPTATRTSAAPSGPAWWDCRYAFRKPITIVASRVVGDQADFPVLVSLASDPGLAGRARDDGFDIAFTSSNGTTKLAHEIEEFNGQTGEMVAWVKVPMVSSSKDTVIYLYYGNPSSGDQQDTQAVWPGYEGVWHLSQAVGSGDYLANSALSDHHGTPEGTFFNASGKMGGARRFASDDIHYIAFGNDSALFGGWKRWAFGLWIYPDYPSDGAWESSGEDSFIHAGGPVHLGRVRREGWEESGQGTLQIDVQFAGVGTVYVWKQILRQAWNHVAYSYDGSEYAVFFNGVEVARESVPGESLLPADYFNLGGAYEVLEGSLDEFRVSTRERSAGWVLTEYNNQASPASFIRVAVEATGPVCAP